MARYEFVAWKDEGVWTVHSPALVGVYGVGDTLNEAKEDFVEAADLLLGYLEDLGEKPPKSTTVKVGSVDL